MSQQNVWRGEAGRARIVIPLIVLLVAAATVVVWRVVWAKPRDGGHAIFLSGRIEGDDSAVAGKATGRLLEVTVREGDQVKAGDVIAVLDDEQLRARVEQARAQSEQADSRLEWSRRQIAVLDEQLHQNAVETGQSKTDASGRVSQAQGELAAAEADLAQQQAAYKLAVFEIGRASCRERVYHPV